jgi:hypothetical protein
VNDPEADPSKESPVGMAAQQRRERGAGGEKDFEAGIRRAKDGSIIASAWPMADMKTASTVFVDSCFYCLSVLGRVV